MTGPVRNLQIITSPGVGGRELVPPVLAAGLAAQGHPTWLMARPGSAVEHMGQELGLRVAPTKLSGYCDFVHALPLAAFLKHHRIQILHSHWTRDLSNLILAAGLAGGLPVVCTKHVYATENKHDPFHAWIVRHTNRFIGVSRLVSENLIQTLRVPAAKVTTIYNGIELSHWDPARHDPQALHRRLGLPAGCRVLGYAGRLNAGKGPHLILEAFAKLAQRFPEWHFVAVGKAVGDSEEHYARELAEKAASLGLGARVHFPGYQADMPAVMAGFELFACASAFESLGMVLVEAMAMQCAVVGPDTGGVPEIIQPGENGEMFHYPEVSDLAAILAALMADPGRRRRLGEVGRRTVEKKFNLAGMVRQTAELYRSVLAPSV